MTEEGGWEPCLFDEDGLLGCPAVHDHFVYAVAAFLERRLLTLHTQYRDGDGPYDLTDVRFFGVAAHHFEHIAEPSILLDIEAVSVDWVVENWSELFDRGLRYGWPLAKCVDLSDLTGQLVGRGIRGYRVMGSCGLDGFVLALEAKYRRRAQEAESM
jgi:hypothetical protein